MADPRSINFPEEDDDVMRPRSNGISVTYVKSRQTISVHGWYDSMVGIPGGEMPLETFLERLGISDADIRKARKRGEQN